MIQSVFLFSVSLTVLLSVPMSAMQLIAAGILVVSGTFNILLRTHLTYTLTNHETGQVYLGRTSGFGEPAKILRRRMYGHRYIRRGFSNPVIDVAMQGNLGYLAIRGREQQLIDYSSGIGHPRVANIRRGVAKIAFARKTAHNLSNKYFGALADYTGF